MKKQFLLLLFLHLALATYSQQYIPKVSTFTTEDGLSSDEVQAIHKDSRGFLWIGTQYGLNRFDGQEFKVFTRENTPELDFDIINEIMEDGEGNLWLVKSQEKYQHNFSTIAINLFNIYSGKVQTLEEYFGSKLPFEVKDITFIQQLSDASIFIRCNKIQKTFRYQSNEGFQPISFPNDFVQMADVLLMDDHFLVSAAAESDFSIYEINWSGEIFNKGHWGLPWTIRDGEKTQTLEAWGHFNLRAFEHFSPDWETLNSPSLASETSIYQTKYNPALNLFWLREHHRISAVSTDGQLVFTYPLPEKGFEKTPFFFDGTTTWFSTKKEGLVGVTLEPNHFQTFQFFENPIDNSMRGITKDETGALWFSSMHGLGKMNERNQVSIIEVNHGFSNFFNDSKGNI